MTCIQIQIQIQMNYYLTASLLLIATIIIYYDHEHCKLWSYFKKAFMYLYWLYREIRFYFQIIRVFLEVSAIILHISLMIYVSIYNMLYSKN